MSGAPRRRAFVPLTRRMARLHHPDPLNPSTVGHAPLSRRTFPTTVWEQEVKKGLEGLPGASRSKIAKSRPSRVASFPLCRHQHLHEGAVPRGCAAVGNYDATVMGVPYDGGTTYRSGTRFGPQGIRRISALYSPYNYELGVDLREQMTLCDAGDVFTIPANIEKTFDQISNAVAHVAASGSFPIILGGDHSIGFPTVRGLASVTSKRIGIIHFDRHADIQEKDLDERMHPTPYFHATEIPNVRPENLVQIGIGGWQVPRAAVPIMRRPDTNIFSVGDVEESGRIRSWRCALDRAWDGTDAVWMSLTSTASRPASCRGPAGRSGASPARGSQDGRPRRGGGLCGMEVVEVSPPMIMPTSRHSWPPHCRGRPRLDGGPWQDGSSQVDHRQALCPLLRGRRGIGVQTAACHRGRIGRDQGIALWTWAMN